MISKELEVGKTYLVKFVDSHDDMIDDTTYISEVTVVQFSNSGKYVKLNFPGGMRGTWYDKSVVVIEDEL